MTTEQKELIDIIIDTEMTQQQIDEITIILRMFLEKQKRKKA